MSDTQTAILISAVMTLAQLLVTGWVAIKVAKIQHQTNAMHDRIVHQVAANNLAQGRAEGRAEQLNLDSTIAENQARGEPSRGRFDWHDNKEEE